jgi:hypothetical protein
MCLISIAPKGMDKYSEFFIKAIRQGATNNSDGSGFAVKYVNGVIYIHKGFKTPDELIDALKEKKIPRAAELVVHSRIGTSGLVSTENCHPFVVNEHNSIILKNKEYITDFPVMAHNGVFSKFTDRQSIYSDTYHFVQKFLGVPEVRDILERDLEKFSFLFKDNFINFNKIAILFPKKDKEMITIGDFTEEKGYKFSNRGYCDWNVRNVGGVESHIDSDSRNFNPQRAIGFNPKMPRNLDFDAIDADTPRDNGISELNTVENLIRLNKYRLTELNYQDFFLKATKTIHSLDKDTIYHVKEFNSKTGDVQLGVWNQKITCTNVPIHIVEDNCEFQPKITNQILVKYTLFDKFIKDLDEKKIAISKTMFKRMLKKLRSAKNEEIYVRYIGKVSVDAVTVFIDQFRHLDTAKERNYIKPEEKKTSEDAQLAMNYDSRTFVD